MTPQLKAAATRRHDAAQSALTGHLLETLMLPRTDLSGKAYTLAEALSAFDLFTAYEHDLVEEQQLKDIDF